MSRTSSPTSGSRRAPTKRRRLVVVTTVSAVVAVGAAVAVVSSQESTEKVSATGPRQTASTDPTIRTLPGVVDSATSSTNPTQSPEISTSASTLPAGTTTPPGATGPSMGKPASSATQNPAKDAPTGTGAGTRPGSTLTKHAGDLEISVDGTSISNLDIQGNLFVVANNVTVTNVKVGGYVAINRGRTGIAPLPVKRNMKFSNIDVRTIDNVGLDTVVVDRARFRGATDSTHFQATSYRQGGNFWKCDGLTLTNSLFDPPPPIKDPEVHLEALHPMGCSNLVIRNNVFDMTAPNPETKRQTTGIMMLQTWNDRVNENVVFDGNELRGGGYYQLYLHAKNMSVTNNRFHSYPQGAPVYPPSANSETYYPFTQSGNTLDGKPITLVNSK
ncbi:hypothetical protein [Embleya sp. NPDC001921]